MTIVRTIDHVQIAMPEGREDDARHFYCDQLGLAEAAKPAAIAGRGGVWFHLGAIGLHLGVEKDFRPAKKAHIAFAVADLDGLRSSISGASLPVTDDNAIENRRRFFTEDFFGNRIEIIGFERSVG